MNKEITEILIEKYTDVLYSREECATSQSVYAYDWSNACILLS